MEAKSLSGHLSELLRSAKTAHTIAVQLGRATDDDWPEWYGEYVSKRLAPLLACVQEHHGVPPYPPPTVTVKGKWYDGGPGWIAEASQRVDASKVLPRQALEEKLFGAYTGRSRRNPPDTNMFGRRNPHHVSD
jgi:hypothetical protein